MASKYIYNQTFYNSELGVTKTIKAETKWEFDLKVNQMNERWNQQIQLKRKREMISNNQQTTEAMDKEQKQYIKEYENILKYTLSVNDKLNWETQYRKDNYKKWTFNETEPNKEEIFEENNVSKEIFFEKIFKKLKEKREAKEKEATEIYEKAIKEYNNRKKKSEEEYNREKEKFEKEKENYNKEIDEWQKNFEEGEQEATERYIKVVLENSKYPKDFDKDYEIEYRKNEKILVISYNLPNTDKISKVEGYKYIKTKNEIKAVEMKKAVYEEFYENIIFNITLRTIHEIFESTNANIIDMVVFNGFVTGIDKSNGKEFTNCIISLQVNRKEFEDINLANIEPKECVRALKGLFAGKLAQLAPVKPIMNLNKEDRRFIESKEILDNMGAENNLAEMPWEDFEHLVREVFAKEFSKDGAEVKVTQSSRDGGVDAIAFDPDPIRGGKFVIQAKRYNNVVPISAVRDLYGTMINEGATKGILVTTSYFGTDSQNFVKDKPLTLIDGQNLIYMMKKYGYDNVFIELKK